MEGQGPCLMVTREGEGALSPLAVWKVSPPTPAPDITHIGCRCCHHNGALCGTAASSPMATLGQDIFAVKNFTVDLNIFSSWSL